MLAAGHVTVTLSGPVVAVVPSLLVVAPVPILPVIP